MSFCEETLRDVFGWRGCLIFLTHLFLRLRDFFVEMLRDFFLGCMIFVVKRLCEFFWRLRDFFCGEIAGFFCGEVAFC